MPTQINVCSMCTRYLLDRRCEAYATKIPDSIWEGRSAHTAFIGDEDQPVVLLVRSRADAGYLRDTVPAARLALIQVSP